MSAQTLTVISGVVLLLVFLLVGWNTRRRHRDHERAGDRPNERASD